MLFFMIPFMKISDLVPKTIKKEDIATVKKIKEEETLFNKYKYIELEIEDQRVVIKKNISENIAFLKNEDKVKIKYDYADNKNVNEYKSKLKREKRNDLDELYIKTNQGFIRKSSIEIIDKID